jgi:hypothetical protein
MDIQDKSTDLFQLKLTFVMYCDKILEEIKFCIDEYLTDTKLLIESFITDLLDVSKTEKASAKLFNK